MYNPTLATRRLTTYMDAVRTQWPTLSAEGPPPDASTLARLDDAWLPNPTDWKKGETVRALTLAEQQLILVEVLKCKASLRYWLQHYARIKDKDGRSSLVYPLLDSQDIMLAHMAELEMQCAQGLRTDGLLLIILKSRQLGISTLTELVLLHRLLFHSNLYALIAADVEEQSANLFNMIERALRALPWWMRPRITNHVKDSELKFGDIDSLLRVTFANTTRGGTQIGMEKGQLGRGSTVHLFHGSEMSTWSNPGQVDDALDPAIPVSHNTFAVLESTARGRNWWHRKWLSSVAGQSRWHPVFIPWYAERRYQMPAPANWSATTMAVRHAQAVQRDSPRWCGREVTLTRDQLYFWERKYLAAQQERTLYKFLAEYASNDEECFSVSDDGFFPGEVLMDLRGKEWPALANVVYP